jgi:single-strand DNA-binding protein
LEKEVSFFDVETWSKVAENCYNLGHKGRGVRVVGRLKQDRWAGADGKQRSRITIVAEHVEFRPEFKRDGNSADDGPGFPPEAAAFAAASENMAAEAFSDSLEPEPVLEDVEELAEVAF